MEKEKNKFKILDILKFLFPVGLLGSFILYCYNNYFVSPKIEYIYDDKKDAFSVQADFRGITMRVYPQMLICYDNYVILVTHLDEYYDQEFIYFTNKMGYVNKINQEDSDKLMQYIREAVLERLKESQNEDTIEEINEKFKIFISLIGGVQYENKLGNQINKYCIIEQNGLVIDYEFNAEEIEKRLFENEIVLGNDLDMIGENVEINKIIEVVTKEVVQLYERDYSNDS